MCSFQAESAVFLPVSVVRAVLEEQVIMLVVTVKAVAVGSLVAAPIIILCTQVVLAAVAAMEIVVKLGETVVVEVGRVSFQIIKVLQWVQLVVEAKTEK